jgi:hypothetical protein
MLQRSVKVSKSIVSYGSGSGMAAAVEDRGLYTKLLPRLTLALVPFRSQAERATVPIVVRGRRTTKRAPAAGSVHMSPPWSRTVCRD